MTLRHCVAIDLGASSGRVMLARYDGQQQRLELSEIHRFANGLRKVDGYDCWDVDALEQEIRHGLQQVCDLGIRVDSFGIDTWGVDYVLIDKNGQRIGLPIAYRDHRTDGVMERACAELGREDIYQRSGIQFLPFNTLYQFRALRDSHPEWCQQAERALLIPDYLGYRLTGELNWEYTNATTTQLINIETDNWDSSLLEWAGAPQSWFGTPAWPGRVVGNWICRMGNKIPQVSVASHDTASAVLATPLADADAAYLSSGTWSLIGFESMTPYTSPQALAANITNEGGAEGRYRVLKNIMGLWLLQRITSELQESDIGELIARAARLPACRSVINPNDDRFLNPEHMVTEIQAACRETAQPVPTTAAELARCIFDSLALLYASALHSLEQVRGRRFSHLHVVGGGSQNPLLNQLCADACGLPLLAGPVEASTLGNIGCQLMALDELADVTAVRQLITKNYRLTRYTPNSNSEIARLSAQFQHSPTRELCA
ncbi:rhamnulokinase [Salmonella enterica subsp. enterica serovar Choleraesuis]|nr:rhamnulokinase [Salmonella enterica subsp. enterica serovar Choleraesuis]